MRSALPLRSVVAMAEDSSADEEWPPPAARARSALWRAQEHLERAEYFHAVLTLEEVFAREKNELARGLYHLAAAGYRHERGDADGAANQVAHARRRLEPFLGEAEISALLHLVAR